jgi:hypothetical protein
VTTLAATKMEEQVLFLQVHASLCPAAAQLD